MVEDTGGWMELEAGWGLEVGVGVIGGVGEELEGFGVGAVEGELEGFGVGTVEGEGMTSKSASMQ